MSPLTPQTSLALSIPLMGHNSCGFAPQSHMTWAGGTNLYGTYPHCPSSISLNVSRTLVLSLYCSRVWPFCSAGMCSPFVDPHCTSDLSDGNEIPQTQSPCCSSFCLELLFISKRLKDAHFD